jgi:hypothetical protein
VIEGVDFADVEFAAGEHADAGGGVFAVLIDHCKCRGGAGLELFEAPGLVEALLGLDLDEVGEEGVGGGGDEVEGDWRIFDFRFSIFDLKELVRSEFGGAGEDVEGLVGVGEAMAEGTKELDHGRLGKPEFRNQKSESMTKSE